MALLALALLAATQLAISAPVTPARPRRPLARLVQDGDYPQDALARNEQGTVFFSLAVRADGRVGHCRLTRSSGSSSLDARTCEIMLRHARFAPARDSEGNAVPDTFQSSLGWFLASGR